MTQEPHHAQILLQSDRLRVEIARPETVYTGTRFDWTGFVTQITLDGRHTFCVPESYQSGQGTGGIGLCNEFGIDQPIGYDDAQPGESFPKLGIGLLRRPDEPEYSFGKPHEIVARFPIHVASTADTATFTVEPLDCRGYAARLIKTLSVNQNWLTINYALHNTGSKPINTLEYCHNFVALDAQPIGPDYRLRFPYLISLEQMDERFMAWMKSMLDVRDHDIAIPHVPEHAFYCRPLGYAQTNEPQWELTHLPSGLMMREYDDFAPCRVAVWGTSHVICAEIFAPIHLKPEESVSWTRRYEFLHTL